MMVITCECGAIIKGGDEAELVGAAHDHLRTAHPDLVGAISDEQLLGMAETVA